MSTLEQLGGEKYVSLTTFRRSGAAVPTAVWAVHDGDALLVVTNAASGKVTRLRHTTRVTLTPCDVRGRTADDPEVTEAHAVVVEDPAELRRLQGLLNEKYGLAARLVALGGKLRPGSSTVEVRITPAG